MASQWDLQRPVASLPVWQLPYVTGIEARISWQGMSHYYSRFNISCSADVSCQWRPNSRTWRLAPLVTPTGCAMKMLLMMSEMASQITSVLNVGSSVCSGADQRKHQSSVSLAFVRGIHRWLVASPHKGPATRKTFPFHDVSFLENIHERKATRDTPYPCRQGIRFL